MKTTIYSCIAMFLLAVLPVMAVPVSPDTVVVIQPDGNALRIVGHGDEFLQYTTTVDGYTVKCNADGFYVYVSDQAGRAAVSSVVAHDPGHRSVHESAFLSVVRKHYVEEQVLQRARALRQDFMPRSAVSPWNTWKSKNRGIVILVNTAGREFMMGDSVQTFFDHMYNGENFNSYIDVSGKAVTCTGSVRQYWHDNSFGVYNPRFDIVGPVSVNINLDTISIYSNNIIALAVESMNEAMKSIDVAQYDSDSDGYIDFVIFLFAGIRSAQNGLTPHARINHSFETHTDATFAGKKINECAFVCESGGPGIDPIGIICHEFGHILGLPDVADDSDAYNPKLWDLMSFGYQLNSGYTPVGLTLPQRLILGFTQEIPILKPNHSYTLPPSQDSGFGYIWESTVDSSCFVLENRQHMKWDAYAPEHGLIVYRWALNPYSHNGFYTGIVQSSGLVAVGSSLSQYSNTAYPGAGNVRILGVNTASQPFVWSFLEERNVYPTMYIYDIEETDRVVKFNTVSNADVTTLTESFCLMDATPTMNEKQWQGQNFVWDFYKAGVEDAPDSLTNLYLSARTLKMAMPSKIETTNYVCHNVYQLSIGVYNPNNVSVRVELSYSTDGNQWKTAKAITGYDYNEVYAHKTKRVGWSINENVPLLYRLTVNSKTNYYVYFEDIYIEYKDYVPGDINEDGNVDIDDLNMVVNVILETSQDVGYRARADVNGDGTVDIDDVNAVVNAVLAK